MADETRTPEDVAREWLGGESTPLPSSDMEELTLGLADLIREERERAFYAGAESGRLFGTAVGKTATASRRAARRLAVEGRSDGE